MFGHAAVGAFGPRLAAHRDCWHLEMASVSDRFGASLAACSQRLGVLTGVASLVCRALSFLGYELRSPIVSPAA
jgi:hypothetical protein